VTRAPSGAERIEQWLGPAGAAYHKLTRIRSVGVDKWAAARYASADGYKLIATNAVIKKAIVRLALGGPIKKVTGADKGIEWPQVL
jgi:hypothetical protein